MRLALSILLIGIVLAVPGVTLGDTVFEREIRDQSAASRIGTAVVWPDAPNSSNPEDALRILTDAAEATGSNVIRTSIGMSETGRTSISHYLYLEKKRTRLFDEFTLAEGRWLTWAESRSGQAIVTSARSERKEVVGAPKVFADGYDLTFAPLHHAFDSLPTAGRYVIESPDDAATDRFVEIIRQRLVEQGVTDLTVEDILADETRFAPRSDIGPYDRIQVLPYALIAIATLLVAAILLREGKRIGVLRLLGYSTTRIWYWTVGRLQIASVLSGMLACGALLFILPGADVAFAWKLAGGIGGVTAVIFGVTLIVGLIAINRIHFGDLIKGSL